MRPRKAVIPAAGLGTRFLPATKVLPKELLPIVDRPALEVIAEELLASGIEEIVLVVSPGKEEVLSYFQPDPSLDTVLKKKGRLDRMAGLQKILDQVTFTKALQKEPRGLGHAVFCAREAVGDESFAVILPDDLVRSTVPCLRQLIDAAETYNMSAVAVEEVADSEVHKYGIVGGATKGDRTPFKTTSIVEKPPIEKAPSRWAIIGRYVFDPDIFAALEATKPGALGEIQLTDAMVALAEKKGLYALPFEGLRIDAGQPPGWIEANLRYAMDDETLKKFLRPLLQELIGSSS